MITLNKNTMNIKYYLNKNIILLFVIAVICIQCKEDSKEKPIDRYALVTRHNIEWDELAGQIPLGNGEFCFNVDGTGLQTFGGNTMAHWAWHSFPLPDDVTQDQIPATGTFQQGRNTGPDVFPEGKMHIRKWMFDNPHSFNLGRFRLINKDGQSLVPEQIDDLSRTMDLWTGIQTSTFKVDGQFVEVKSCVNPSMDLISVEINSPLLEEGKLGIGVDFPYPDIQKNKPWVGDFKQTKGNITKLLNDKEKDNSADFKRELDDVNYYTSLNWSDGCNLKLPVEEEPNTWRLDVNGVSELKFTCAFSSKRLDGELPDVSMTEEASKEYWPAFWKGGGAIDLSKSKDPRWKELERRIVLSQYLTAVQSAGSFPPAEIGLMGIDSWRGQFHMEMIWWHLAHYALWDRWEMADSALTIYKRFTPTAKALAEQLGYKGLKWQKSSGPEGRTAPWEGNQVLIWKQPHPIFFAVLDYRLHPNPETLEKWAEIIEGTAEHMADYPEYTI